MVKCRQNDDICNKDGAVSKFFWSTKVLKTESERNVLKYVTEAECRKQRSKLLIMTRRQNKNIRS